MMTRSQTPDAATTAPAGSSASADAITLPPTLDDDKVPTIPPELEHLLKPGGRPGAPWTLAAAAALAAAETGAPVGIAPASRPNREQPRRGGRRLARTLSMVIILALITGAVFGWTSGKLNHLLPGVNTPTLTVAATVTPSPEPPTVTPGPTATATTPPQQLYGQRAFDSFKAVTLSATQDSTCGTTAATTSFTSGQTIYINMCTADKVAGSPLSVTIRQTGNLVCSLNGSGGALNANNYYVCSSGYTLNSGAYDMYVNLRVNGSMVVARSVHFTIA
jgi:hypothetical protein